MGRILFYAVVFWPQILVCLRHWQLSRSRGTLGWEDALVCFVGTLLFMGMYIITIAALSSIRTGKEDRQVRRTFRGLAVYTWGILLAIVTLVQSWFTGIAHFGLEPRSHEPIVLLFILPMTLQGYGGSILWDCRLFSEESVAK